MVFLVRTLILQLRQFATLKICDMSKFHGTSACSDAGELLLELFTVYMMSTRCLLCLTAFITACLQTQQVSVICFLN